MNAQNGKKGDTMSKKPKIEGIVFRYGDGDYTFWMPDISKDENEKFVQTLFAAFEDNGCSVRGTKKDILDAIRENT